MVRPTRPIIVVGILILVTICCVAFPALTRSRPIQSPWSGIAFDEIVRSASSTDDQAGLAIRALRTASIHGFDQDYRWYMSHQPDEYGRRSGPAAEDISLYRYAYAGSLIRFEDDRGATIVDDGPNPSAVTLDFKERTFHRYSATDTRALIRAGAYAPYPGIDVDVTRQIAGSAKLQRQSRIAPLGTEVVAGLAARGERFEQVTSFGGASGSCRDNYREDRTGQQLKTFVATSYRAERPEPRQAYNFSVGFPFREGSEVTCDVRLVDESPKVTVDWAKIASHFLVFERTETTAFRGQRKDATVAIVERGHIVPANEGTSGLFTIPPGFVDDCTKLPRPENCPRVELPKASISRELALRGAAYTLATDSLGDVWFAEPAKRTIGFLANGSAHEFALPAGKGQPLSLAPGERGDMWFSEEYENKLGHALSSGRITESEISYPLQYGPLSSGPDGRVWYADRDVHAFVALAVDGTTVVHRIPGDYPVVVAALTFDQNEALWYIQSNTQKPRVVRYDPAKLTEYTPPHDLSTLSDLTYSAGYLYFSEQGRLARMATSDGHVDEYPLADESTAPNTIVTDRAGALWFDEYPGNRIGWLSPSGKLTECDLPIQDQGGFAIDRDGNPWISTKKGIAEIVPCHPFGA